MNLDTIVDLLKATNRHLIEDAAQGPRGIRAYRITQANAVAEAIALLKPQMPSPARVKCPRCEGTGSRFHNDKPFTCSGCNGVGSVTELPARSHGETLLVSCEPCGGSGSISYSEDSLSTCEFCNGQGRFLTKAGAELLRQLKHYDSTTESR